MHPIPQNIYNKSLLLKCWENMAKACNYVISSKFTSKLLKLLASNFELGIIRKLQELARFPRLVNYLR